MNIYQAKLTALDWIFDADAEGGLVGHPNGSGGIANLGISLRYLKEQSLAISDINGDGDINGDDIHNLPRYNATEIYLRDFWFACYCPGLPPHLAITLFDMAVNVGQSTAVRLLQEILNVKNDGLTGPKTRSAANAANSDTLLPYYFARRAQYYHDITLANSSLATFLRGWMNRLFLLQQYILEKDRLWKK